MQVGEFERLKEFGINKRVIQEYGASIGETGFINAKQQITDVAKFNDVLFSFMEKKSVGGMEKLSKTTAGLWSTIKGVFKTSMAEIVGVTKRGTIVTGGVMDTLKTSILQPLADQLIKWSSDGTFIEWGYQLSETIKSIAPFFQDLRGVIDNFITGINDIPSAFKKFEKALKPILAAIVTSFAAAAVAMFAANPVLYGALATGAVIGYKGMQIYQGFEEDKAKKEAWRNSPDRYIPPSQMEEMANREVWSDPSRIKSSNDINNSKKIVNPVITNNINISGSNLSQQELQQAISKGIEEQKLFDQMADGLL